MKPPEAIVPIHMVARDVQKYWPRYIEGRPVAHDSVIQEAFSFWYLFLKPASDDHLAVCLPPHSHIQQPSKMLKRYQKALLLLQFPLVFVLQVAGKPTPTHYLGRGNRFLGLPLATLRACAISSRLMETVLRYRCGSGIVVEASRCRHCSGGVWYPHS